VLGLLAWLFVCLQMVDSLPQPRHDQGIDLGGPIKREPPKVSRAGTLQPKRPTPPTPTELAAAGAVGNAGGGGGQAHGRRAATAGGE
jgi:hypothetical protein